MDWCTQGEQKELYRQRLKCEKEVKEESEKVVGLDFEGALHLLRSPSGKERNTCRREAVSAHSDRWLVNRSAETVNDPKRWLMVLGDDESSSKKGTGDVQSGK